MTKRTAARGTAPLIACSSPSFLCSPTPMQCTFFFSRGLLLRAHSIHAVRQAKDRLFCAQSDHPPAPLSSPRRVLSQLNQQSLLHRHHGTIRDPSPTPPAFMPVTLCSAGARVVTQNIHPESSVNSLLCVSRGPMAPSSVLLITIP